MEDMARLAFIEQNCLDPELFTKTLRKLLDYFQCIFDYPHKPDCRRIKSSSLQKSLEIAGFTDYLKYLGFEIKDNGELVLPDEASLDKLKIASTALERKLHFVNENRVVVDNEPSAYRLISENKYKLQPVNILHTITNNPFLLHLEDLFNDVLKYEDEEVLRLARQHIPIVALQMKAIDRVRERQLELKNGEASGEPLSYDVAFLMELVGWYKSSFYTWLDTPECTLCGGPTVFVNTDFMVVDTETCRVEHYRCKVCTGGAAFPRVRACKALLSSRRGRCGEWADCFALLLRSLNYTARFVQDTTDHVWCEVFDFESNKWLHVDPCEGKVNSPLMYEHGWGKKLEYVIAVSNDDIQDVTWRYSSNHKAVRQRRVQCTEQELLQCILLLREKRQQHVSEARRKYLLRRNLNELVEMLTEKKPTDYESFGRISGSKEWRTQRGEIGKKSYTFLFNQPGLYSIKYYTAIDKYKVSRDNVEENIIKSWANGVFECKHVFRKEEKDWKMVYLAREEGESEGLIAWSASAESKGLRFDSITISANAKLYENGRVVWKLKFDDKEPIPIQFNDNNTFQMQCQFSNVTLTAQFKGGLGDTAWQHAQLFRQSLDAKCSELDITVNALLVP